MPLPRLELTGRVGDQVFTAIRSAITSGELRAGDRLRIRELADELGTSVMPVREAIRRLEEVGLAEAQPYRGAVVKGFTDKELLDLYAVRRLLEVEATALGAPLVAGADVELMQQHLEAMESAVGQRDALSYLDRDEDFLAALYAASANPVLVSSIRTLWSRCRSYKILGAEQAFAAGAEEQLLTFQTRLLAAVATGDIESTVNVTAESLDAAIERIRTSMDSASDVTE